MWRSLFLALGIFSLILGAETLVVDKYLMADGQKLPRIIKGSQGQINSPFQQAGYQNYAGPAPRSPNRVVQTKDWMPWSLLATGTIIVLYTYSLPLRGQSE